MSGTLVRKLIISFGFLVPILLFQNCGLVRPAEVLDISSTSPRFEAAKAILQKNCISCHGAGTSMNLSHTKEQDFVTSGAVSPGDIHLSKLIFRLQNYSGTATGARNMPPAGALTADEYQALVDWVSNITVDSNGVACAPNEHLLKPQIKRLTSAQYRNSILNAFGSIFTNNQFPTLNDGNPRNGLANDPDRLTVNEVNMNSFYDSAISIAATARAQVADLASCVNAANDNCYSTLISNYGLRLWRRPVTTAESTDLLAGLPAMTSTSATRAQKIDYLLASMILSPNHLFRTELGAGTSLPVGIFQLSQYEVASLLSFGMWDGPPDATLLNLAQTNQLHSVDVLKTQVARMANDNKFRNQMTGFMVDMLKIDDVRTITKDASYNLTTTERDQLHVSAVTSLNAAYASANASIMAPFTNQTFYANSSTQRFFGLSGLSGTMSPVTVSSNERYGILSHPAFLTAMSGQLSSGIVKRGVFTLEQLLCYHLDPAPADINGVVTLPPGYDPNQLTSREVLRISHSSQARCTGCHSIIDPAGFGFESFNALGQFRLTEKAANVPIDSSGRIAGVTREEIVFGNSVQYFQSLGSKTELRSCVQKHFFKYTSGQSAKVGAGRCEYQNLERKLNSSGNSIRALMEGMVELESFIRRRVQ